MSKRSSNDQKDLSPESSKSKRRFDLVDLFSSRLPMGPRKKSKSGTESKDGSNTKPDAPAASADNSSLKSTTTLLPATSQNPLAVELKDTPGPSEVPANGNATKGQVDNRNSWYGSWKQKAKPVAEVARESISANGKPESASPAASRPRPSKEEILTPSPKRYLSGSSIRSTKGTPLAATMTKLDISSNGKPESSSNSNAVSKRSSNSELRQPDPPLPPDPVVNKDTIESHTKDPAQDAAKAAVSSSWFGWWSRPDGYEEAKTDLSIDVQQDVLMEEAKKKPLPGTTPLDESPAQSRLLPPVETSMNSKTTETPTKDQNAVPVKKASIEDTRSWFGLWSSAQNTRPDPAPSEDLKSTGPPEDPKPNIDAKKSSEQPSVTTEATPSRSSKPPSVESQADSARRKASGWAFWSRESPDSRNTSGNDAVHKQVGELAVANTPSQSRPEAAQFNEQDEPLKKEPQKVTPKELPKAALKAAQARPPKKKANLDLPATPTKASPSPSPTFHPVDLAAQAEVNRNLVLPSFETTYSLVQQSTLWQQIRQYFIGGEPDTPHLYRAVHSPRIKKALAIGIHGFFPSPLFQKVLGAPTGTSIRFANSAAASIKSWTEKQGYECEIEKVALEGEGFIADRIDMLWKLLLNWVEQIRSADFIMVACHSQGVPVAIMLVAKLIQFGCITSARIGICAMAGVNLGPFAEYKTRIFGGTALELFEFSNPASKVSKLYQDALEGVLKYGVKVVYVGSIDDQLVSLESSTFSNISHPCIYRAVFIDGRLHASDFITELVGFALKLRNLGLSDHGLIRELSPALAGSLYTGEGHSRLYDSPLVYNLAVFHALETTPLPDIPLVVKNYEGPPGSKESNPFFLPWAMRGILEEEKVRKELGDECRQLLALFEDWRPTSKGLKDVKFRLEALKSKL